MSYLDISYLLPTPSFSHIRIGAYPSQEQADELIDDGYEVFVDLTLRGEVINEYIIPTNIVYICFPIIDKSIPSSNQSFFSLIKAIGKLSVLGEKKVYVHCLGGHGRSGLLGISFLIYLKYIELIWDSKLVTSLPYQSVTLETMKIVTDVHKTRKIMKERWRLMDVPQTRIQRNYCTLFSYFMQTKLSRK